MNRKFMITAIIVLLITVVPAEGYSQKNEISLDFGAGNTTVSSQFEFVYPLKPYYDGFYQVGAKYTYTSAENPISLYTGLTFDRKALYHCCSEYYLKVPLGFHLHFGNKLKFHLGAGLNAGFSRGSYNTFTLGAFLNAGPSVQLSEKYRLMLSCQFNSDLTPMGVEYSTSMAGRLSGPEYTVRGYDGFVLLSIFRKMGKK